MGSVAASQDVTQQACLPREGLSLSPSLPLSVCLSLSLSLSVSVCLYLSVRLLSLCRYK